ncbi:hypothetical protein BH20ACT8_BH20ACT8_16370 [soil metagenome]
MRTCHRTGCRWPAVASLSFRYGTSQVWLLDLSDERDPSLYDLCPHHADALTVPRGWQRVDERTVGSVVAEPAGRDLVDGDREPVGSGGYGNRYAALEAALPRLAAELAASQPADQFPPEAAVASPALPPGAPPRRPAIPSRDLAPTPMTDQAEAEAEAAAADAADRDEPSEPAELAGQLALEVPEAGRGTSGVVVPFALAGSRRRPDA